MIPLDLNSFRTVVRDIGGKPMTWTIRFIPNGRFDEIEAAMLAAFSFLDGEAPKLADLPAYESAMRQFVRWGVRATSAPFPLGFTTETFAGVAYEVLDDATLDVLARVNAGAFLGVLGREVRDANRLTEADLLGFR